jgi:hypothetical protein
VNATDNVAIQWVRFYRWDPINHEYVTIAYDTAAPYTRDLDTCNLSAKWNQIFAEALDTYGNRNWAQPQDRKFIYLYRYLTLYLPLISR